MSPLIRTSYCLVFVLGVAASAHALDADRLVTQYDQRHWDSSNGLPQNSGLAIVQDHDGYTWMGTEEGSTKDAQHVA
jgi:ligand-binding sensor domain-containing protein